MPADSFLHERSDSKRLLIYADSQSGMARPFNAYSLSALSSASFASA